MFSLGYVIYAPILAENCYELNVARERELYESETSEMEDESESEEDPQIVNERVAE